MACKDCENSNPVTPVYSDAKYVLNPNCADLCGPDIYVPPDGEGSGVAAHELIAGTDILIEDFSDAVTLKHRISYDPFTVLTASISLDGYVAGVIQPSIILQGKVVDETRTAWSYNKGVITSQTLDEGSGPIAVLAVDRNKTSTGLTITDDITYLLQGDDGQGEVGSIANASDSLLFGNYMIWGDYTNMIGQSILQVSDLIANLDSKNQEIRRNRSNSVFATGLTNRRFFVIYPAIWGESIFTKSGFEGGFMRLKNEDGVLVTTIVTLESPIEWTNEEGHIEEIYIYQTLYDNAEDLITPIIIT